MSANAESMSTVAAAEAPMFVINLCASTTPVALVQPNSPELKRYTFFVTRRREEGRERFRLHMGYFDTQEQAEGLLADVREVYPAAWVGPAPGPGLGHKPPPRAIVAPVMVFTAAPAAIVAVAAAAESCIESVAVAPEAPAQRNAPSVAAMPPAVVENIVAARPVGPLLPAVDQTQSVPTLSALVQPELTLLATGVTPVLSPPVPETAVAAAEPPVELSLVEDQPRQPVEGSIERPLDEMSNVREVLALLDAAPQAANPSAPSVELNPVQELTLLEEGPARADLADTAIRMMTPEDTQTLRDIKLDTHNKAPPCFAVQLVWSVTPIDMNKYPQLAIFRAYTLYHVEGNRQGRRWYGVRLGFFSDAHAAKQVAYYMKADYSAVVVVPVAVKERERASAPSEAQVAKPPVSRPAPAKAAKGSDMQGFELLPTELQPADVSEKEPLQLATSDDGPARRVRVFGTPVAANPVPLPAATVLPTPAQSRPPKKPTGKRVVARTPARRAEPGQALAMESTLEMLGASTLTLDDDRVQITDPALRRAGEKAKPKNGLRFSRLLGRLTERLGDNRR